MRFPVPYNFLTGSPWNQSGEGSQPLLLYPSSGLNALPRSIWKALNCSFLTALWVPAMLSGICVVAKVDTWINMLNRQRAWQLAEFAQCAQWHAWLFVGWMIILSLYRIEYRRTRLRTTPGFGFVVSLLGLGSCTPYRYWHHANGMYSRVVEYTFGIFGTPSRMNWLPYRNCRVVQSNYAYS